MPITDKGASERERIDRPFPIAGTYLLKPPVTVYEQRAPARGEMSPETLPPGKTAVPARWGGYLLGIAICELAVSVVDPRLGFLLHMVVLFALLVHSSVGNPADRPLLVALALVPLLRIVSLGAPAMPDNAVGWHALTAVPVLAATLIACTVLGLSRRRLGLCLRAVPLQVGVALVGIPVGIVEYLAYERIPYQWPATPSSFVGTIVVLLVAGFTLELIFRGVLQSTATARLGQPGILLASTAFALIHLVYLSGGTVALALAEGLLLGFLVARTGSILGVGLGRGIANVLLVVVPTIAAVGQPSRAVEAPAAGVAVGSEVSAPAETVVPSVSGTQVAVVTLAPTQVQVPTQVPVATLAPAQIQASTPTAVPADVVTAIAPTTQPGPTPDAVVEETAPPVALAPVEAPADPTAASPEPPNVAESTAPMPEIAPEPAPGAESSPELSEDASQPAPEMEDGVELHVVQPGDTVFMIARARGSTIAAIAEASQLANPNLIFPGQVLRVPVAVRRP